MRTYLAILGLLALVTVALPTALGGHYAGLTADDVSNEPDPADSSLAPAVGNGFGEIDSKTERTSEFNLVLDSRAIPGAVSFVNPNQVEDRLQNTIGGNADSAGPFIYPGLTTHLARWGWWRDKGGGAHYQEAGAAGQATFAKGPNNVIDDGSDNHKQDVSYSDWQSNPQACPADDPTCWQDTGSWDEFVSRGDNPHVPKNLTYAQPSNTGSDSPTIQNFPGDTMYGFVQPGTHASWFSTTTGREGSSNPVRTPGYGLLHNAADGDKRYEWPMTRAGGTWNGALFYTADSSLLMSTQVIASVNPKDLGQTRKDWTSSKATATDVDVYTAISPQVESVYRTAVWDPDDQQDGDVGEAAGVNNEGLKQEVKYHYSVTYPQTFRQIRTQVINPTVETARPYVGLASDLTFGGVTEHEPNTGPSDFADDEQNLNDGDVYHYADYNSGATYTPRVFRENPEKNDYYQPTQDWSEYDPDKGGGEHAWIDSKIKIGIHAVVVTGNWEGRPGTNVQHPTQSGEQNTAAPGVLATFANAGSWIDWNGDTWIGNVDRGTCSTEDEPYCEGFHGYEGTGHKDDPNDYSHHAGNSALKMKPEWRGVCNARVTQVLKPLGTPTNTEGQHAWGTTVPPVGVYKYPIGGNEGTGIVADVTGDNPAVDDNDDQQFSRYVQYGPVEMPMGPDTTNCKSGQWFNGAKLILPTGTTTYPIKVVTKLEIQDNRLGKVDGKPIAGDPTEIVTDVDVVNSWQGATHGYER